MVVADNFIIICLKNIRFKDIVRTKELLKTSFRAYKV